MRLLVLLVVILLAISADAVDVSRASRLRRRVSLAHGLSELSAQTPSEGSSSESQTEEKSLANTLSGVYETVNKDILKESNNFSYERFRMAANFDEASRVWLNARLKMMIQLEKQAATKVQQLKDTVKQKMKEVASQEGVVKTLADKDQTAVEQAKQTLANKQTDLEKSKKELANFIIQHKANRVRGKEAKETILNAAVHAFANSLRVWYLNDGVDQTATNWSKKVDSKFIAALEALDFDKKYLQENVN